MNQRLLPPTFPRYTRIPNSETAFGYLEALLKRLKSACRVTACTGFHNALVSKLFQRVWLAEICNDFFYFMFKQSLRFEPKMAVGSDSMQKAGLNPLMQT